MQKNITTIPYLKIMGEAFSLTWKNRFLGWFGFFVLLSNVGSFDYFHNDSGKNHLRATTETLSRHASWFFIGALLVFFILVAIVVLSIISRGALISSVEKLSTGKTSDFKSAFRKGRSYAWKIFLIALFSGLFLFSAIIILAPPVAFLFLNHNYILGGIMTVLAIMIFIPLIVIVAYLRIFGYLYAVLGGLNPWAAIENAYTLFRKNIRSSLIMAALFFLINLIFFFLIVLAFFLIAITLLPLALLLFVLAGTLGVVTAGIIGLILLAIFILYFRSFLEVFAQTAWILFFHEIAAPKEKEIQPEPLPEIEPLPKTGLPTINSEGE